MVDTYIIHIFLRSQEKRKEWKKKEEYMVNNLSVLRYSKKVGPMHRTLAMRIKLERLVLNSVHLSTRWPWLKSVISAIMVMVRYLHKWVNCFQNREMSKWHCFVKKKTSILPFRLSTNQRPTSKKRETYPNWVSFFSFNRGSVISRFIYTKF